MTNHFYGVLVGLFTAFLISLVPALRSTIVAWLRKDTNVSGEWEWFENIPTSKVGKLTLKQSGGRISGVLERAVSKSKVTKARTYNVTGAVFHDIITLTFVEREDERRRGSMTLTVAQMKEILFGRNSYIEIDQSKPVSDLYVFVRPGFSAITVEDIFRRIR